MSIFNDNSASSQGSIKRPLVSVIIPCFNAEKTINDTLNSALKQQGVNFEIIIINDGSTDNTLSLLQQYKDPRVHLFNAKNSGVSESRNIGVQLSKGQYLAFLDADDLWASNYLASHLEAFSKAPRLGLSYAKIQFLRADGQETQVFSSPYNRPITAFEMMAENRVCTSSNMVCRREVFEQVGGFNEEMSYSEDQEWLLRIACHGQWDIVGLKACLLGYRASSNGLSASLTKMEAGWLDMMSQAKRYAPAIINKKFKHAHAIYLRYLARRALRLKLPTHIGLNYINRALGCYWPIIVLQPVRTLATLSAIYLQHLLPKQVGRTLIKHLVKG